jgi:hypothetical protein
VDLNLKWCSLLGYFHCGLLLPSPSSNFAIHNESNGDPFLGLLELLSLMSKN